MILLVYNYKFKWRERDHEVTVIFLDQRTASYDLWVKSSMVCYYTFLVICVHDCFLTAKAEISSSSGDL